MYVNSKTESDQIYVHRKDSCVFWSNLYELDRIYYRSIGFELFGDRKFLFKKILYKKLGYLL